MTRKWLDPKGIGVAPDQAEPGDVWQHRDEWRTMLADGSWSEPISAVEAQAVMMAPPVVAPRRAAPDMRWLATVLGAASIIAGGVLVLAAVLMHGRADCGTLATDSCLAQAPMMSVATWIVAVFACAFIAAGIGLVVIAKMPEASQDLSGQASPPV